MRFLFWRVDAKLIVERLFWLKSEMTWYLKEQQQCNYCASLNLVGDRDTCGFFLSVMHFLANS